MLLGREYLGSYPAGYPVQNMEVLQEGKNFRRHHKAPCHQSLLNTTMGKNMR